MRIIDDPDVKQALLDGQPYEVTVTVTPPGGTATVITEDNIEENGISINQSSVAGNKLELGSVIAATADFSFLNFDGALDSVVFNGAELYVEGSIAVNGNTETFPIGYFIADRVKKTGKRISVSCFDRMILFDQPVVSTFPTTSMLSDLVDTICFVVGVTFATDCSLLPNNDVFVRSIPITGMTYRQLLGYAAALMGCCAKMNNKGQCEIVWYTAANWDASLAKRFDGGNVAENSVTTTGIKATANGNVTTLAGADGYTLDIQDNQLLINDNFAYFSGGVWSPVSASNVVTSIWNGIGAITYYPASCDLVHNVLAEPWDVINYTEDDGTVKSVAVTDIVYNITAKTVMQSKGETEEEATYAPQDPFTPQQSAAVADASRLKIGRIESTDESIYFDLNSGDIHTQNDTERVVGPYEKATYTTTIEFSDGELNLVVKKNGTQIGKVNIGTSGILAEMDSSQEPSFPKPDQWDNWGPLVQGPWWLAQRIVATGMGLNNVLNGSFVITDKTPSTQIRQAMYAANEADLVDFNYTPLTGTRTLVKPGEVDVQSISYTAGDAAYSVDSETKIMPELVSTDKIAAATGIKVGSSDYTDPNAKLVATEDYVQNYLASLLGDYVVATGTKDYWEWRQWHSGAIECWISYPVSVPANSFAASGNVYAYNGSVAFATDMFASAPRIQLTAQYAGVNYWIGMSTALSSASEAKFRLYREQSLSSANTFYIHVYAKGIVGTNWNP